MQAKGRLRVFGIATWGSQSWLQPPFEAALRETTKWILLLQSRDFAHEQRGRLKKAAAAKIGCHLATIRQEGQNETNDIHSSRGRHLHLWNFLSDSSPPRSRRSRPERL